MASRRSRPRRLLLPILLAAVLAAEITGIALARSIVPIEPVASSPGDVVAVSTMSAGRLRDDTAVGPSTGGSARAADSRRDPRAIRSAIAHRAPSPLTAPVKPRSPAPKPVSGSSTRVRAATPTSNATVRYAGRNHVWIPSLGINRSVSSFACTRTRPPDNYVYRWGCAGRNNVYLLGHAYSVFKPLHDAYVSGRLRKGMKAVYADAVGHVHTYSVTWWRLVAPTTAASWAWAAQSRPSMTLQTCVGARSQYRLMVRLVQVR
jgi:hypothetical protein